MSVMMCRYYRIHWPHVTVIVARNGSDSYTRNL